MVKNNTITMSEYWKSTERYWCKHCKLFVKDTKIERQNHDATPRHQGNLKRFVRDLHKNNEREEREKQRAKDEVARLNGVVAGVPGPSRSSSSSVYGNAPGRPVLKPQGGISQKEQLQQLVDLGVAIPDEFRKELSMTGNWQTVSERLIDPGSEGKAVDSIGFGVRKREGREDEDEEEESRETKKQRWESSHKTHSADNDDDLDALFTQGIRIAKSGAKPEPKQEGESKFEALPVEVVLKTNAGTDPLIPTLKKEPSDGEVHIPTAVEDTGVKQEGVMAVGGVVFKKRTKKNIRQK